MCDEQGHPYLVVSLLGTYTFMGDDQTAHNARKQHLWGVV